MLLTHSDSFQVTHSVPLVVWVLSRLCKKYKPSMNPTPSILVASSLQCWKAYFESWWRFIYCIGAMEVFCGYRICGAIFGRQVRVSQYLLRVCSIADNNRQDPKVSAIIRICKHTSVKLAQFSIMRLYRHRLVRSPAE